MKDMNRLFNLALEMKRIYNASMLSYRLEQDNDATTPKVTYRIDPDGTETITLKSLYFSFVDNQTRSFTFPATMLDKVIKKAEQEVSKRRTSGFENPTLYDLRAVYSQLKPILINTKGIKKLLWVHLCNTHSGKYARRWTRSSRFCDCYIIEQPIVNGECQQGKVFYRPDGYIADLFEKELTRGKPF